MRNLVPCTFEAGTRTIHIPLHEMTGVENIRLIVNETKKVVICSSMQKDNITSCVKDNVNGGWNVTYTTDLPALASGDALTVEIDLGNHNYIDGLDLVLKIKAGDAGDYPLAIGPVVGAQFENILKKTNGAYYLFYGCASLDSVDLSAITEINADYAAAYMFEGCVGVTDIDFSSLVSINGNYAAIRLLSGCASLTDADFSSLASITGNAAGSQIFQNTKIKTLNLSSLTTISGHSAVSLFCAGCSELEYVNFSSLSTIGGNNPFTNAFQNCPKLKSMDLHPNAVKSTGAYNVAATATLLENVRLSTDASANVDFSVQPNLTAASVKNILEHCANANMSGKTITFYSGGLTIQDDADGTIQTLYNAVVNTYGANIANLNIEPYSA